jgi:V8-like Glu-specific endopeptidase
MTMNLESPFLAEELWSGALPAPAAEAWPQAEALPADTAEWLMEAEIGVIGGRDERRRVQDTLAVPFCWIASISVQRQIRTAAGSERKTGLARAGSGLLISPCHVLTAAHVLKSVDLDERGSVKERHEALLVEVAPGRDGSSTPFGSVRAKRWDLHPKFDPEKKGSAHDYAVITLDTAVGDQVFKSLKGRALSYWGRPGGSDATLAGLPVAAAQRIIGARVVTAGYPHTGKGEMKCSSGELRAGAAEKALKGNGPLQQQWIQRTPMFQLTADATEGQSGSPVWTVENGRRYLAGILVLAGKDLNHAITVNDAVLEQVARWTGKAAPLFAPAAPVQPPAAAKEAGDDEAGPEAAEALEAEEDFASDDEAFAGFSPADDLFADEQAFEDEEAFAHDAFEHDQPPAGAVLEQAIQGGERDPDRLTNLLFFARHPELPQGPLQPSHPKFKALAAEWARIQDREVWRAIQAASENRDLVVAGAEVASHDRFFWGKSGKRLRQLVADAAREVDLNPGLLGTIMMAETRSPGTYLSSAKVSSYHIGTDDFYEGRAAIKARVPAYAKVRWDKSQVPESHPNDAKTNPRTVKTIQFDSGPDAVLATAVYVKFYEVRLREIARERGGDFDSLPLEARFALTRMAMAAGAKGAQPRLEQALAGKDIMVRKPIKVVAYQTQRNATVRTAQALHLSEWIFGIPLVPAPSPAPTPAPQPELQDLAFEADDRVGEAAADTEFEDERNGWDAAGTQEQMFEVLAEEAVEAEAADAGETGADEEWPGHEAEALEARDGEEGEGSELEMFDAFEPEAAGEWPEGEDAAFEREDIELPRREVAVGQRIVLDLATTALAGDVDSVRLTIPGRVVRGYHGDASTAQVFELTDADRARPRITFFWVDAGDARQVRAAIRTKAGAQKTLVASFDVKRPKLEKFTAAVGKTQVEKRHGTLGLRFGKLITAPGIKWEWKVTMPKGQGGRVKDVQTVLVDMSRVQHLAPGSAKTRTLVRRHPRKTDPHVQLDGSDNGEPVYSAGNMDPLLAGGESFAGGASDSPFTELPGLATRVSVDERFTYYIMFKPQTLVATDAIWVPIAKATWSWKAQARKTGSGWTVPPVKMRPAFETSTQEFPLYQSNVEENEWQELEEKKR